MNLKLVDQVADLTRRLDALTETLADAPDSATETTDGRAVVSWAELERWKRIEAAALRCLNSTGESMRLELREALK